MNRLQAQASNHIQFQRRLLPSGLTVSLCEFDGWVAASGNPDKLKVAEIAHLYSLFRIIAETGAAAKNEA